MGTMKILDETGDSRFMWDPENKEEINAAREQFNQLKKKGYTAFNVAAKGKKGTVMKEFDPEAGSIIMTPAIQGG